MKKIEPKIINVLLPYTGYSAQILVEESDVINLSYPPKKTYYYSWAILSDLAEDECTKLVKVSEHRYPTKEDAIGDIKSWCKRLFEVTEEYEDLTEIDISSEDIQQANDISHPTIREPEYQNQIQLANSEINNNQTEVNFRPPRSTGPEYVAAEQYNSNRFKNQPSIQSGTTPLDYL